MKNKENQIALLDQQGFFNLPITEWKGREFVHEGKRYVDFAGTNYLGFDFDPLFKTRGIELMDKWGSNIAQSRMELDPVFYADLEKRLCGLVGCRKVHLSHTITITNFSVIPNIVKKGIIFADSKVHTVVWEACRLARDHGAAVETFRHQDLAHLESLLKKHRDIHPKMIAVDGVYSISSELSPIRELQALCEKYEAWLYVDDAHGFGILGAEPTDLNPYGTGGSGIINRAGGNYERTFYVAGFSKAFCTYSAFVTIPNQYEENVRATSTQYLFSSPPSPFMIGMVNAALDLNEQRGEKDRAQIRELIKHFVTGLFQLKKKFSNLCEQPVVYLELGEFPKLLEVSERLKKGGVVAGLRAYPVVPATECGLRFAITSLHTKEQVDRVLSLL